MPLSATLSDHYFLLCQRIRVTLDEILSHIFLIVLLLKLLHVFLNCAQPQSHAISAYFHYFYKTLITLNGNSIVFRPIMLFLYSHKDKAQGLRKVMRSLAQLCLFLLFSMLISNQQSYSLLYGTPIVYQRPRDYIDGRTDTTASTALPQAPPTFIFTFTLLLARTYVHQHPAI